MKIQKIQKIFPLKDYGSMNKQTHPVRVELKDERPHGPSKGEDNAVAVFMFATVIAGFWLLFLMVIS